MSDYGTNYSLISPKIKSIIDSKNNDHVKTLYRFLGNAQFVVGKGDVNTMVSDLTFFKNYNLPSSDVPTFVTYMEEVRKTGANMHFTERQDTSRLDASGIMIDFDRKQLGATRELTNLHFNRLTTALYKIFLEVFRFETTTKFHVVYIIRPELSKFGDYYKDGFHILIPELWAKKTTKRYILDKLRPKLTSIFSDITHDVEESEKMLDAGSASVPVMFYGSCKKDKSPYVIHQIYEITVDMMDGEPDVNKTTIAIPECNQLYELSLTFNLKELNGKKTWLQKRRMELRDGLDSEIQDRYQRRTGEIPLDELDSIDNTVNCMMIKDPEYNYYAQLLDILDESYVNEYDKWTKVIWALTNTKSNYKSLAIKFSQRCPSKFDKDKLDEIWDAGVENRVRHKNPISIRSIIYWAKACNPEKFQIITFCSYQEVVQEELLKFDGKLEHASIGKLIKLMQGDRFVCINTKSDYDGKVKTCWYKYILPEDAEAEDSPWLCYKWFQLYTPSDLFIYMFEKMPIIFDNTLAYAKGEIEKENDFIKYWKGFVGNIKDTKKDLGKNGFQKGCIDQAAHRFISGKFAKELDNYSDIIGVRNGVLKLGPKVEHVRGYNDYSLSQSLKIKFIRYGSNEENDERVRELLGVFKDIFPEPDVFEYMMCLAASGLDRKIAAFAITVLLGGGSNGKSFYLTMCENTLDMFASIIHSGLMTDQHTSAEKPNSAKMAMKDKRFIYMDEFAANPLFKSLAIKQFTGTTKQSARDLNSRQEKFYNYANLLLSINTTPIIPDKDHGTWRRMKVYNCKTKFTLVPEKENKHEKLANPFYINQAVDIVEYQQAMLSIMVMYYEIYAAKYSCNLMNIPVPTIDAETEEYRKTQDTLHRYICEMMVKVDKCKETIHLSDLAENYTQWYKSNISASERKMRKTIIEELKCSVLAKDLIGGAEFLKSWVIRSHPGEEINPEDYE